jgi:hypothetical protein
MNQTIRCKDTMISRGSPFITVLRTGGARTRSHTKTQLVISGARTDINVNLEMPSGPRIYRGVETENLLARNEHKINAATVPVLTNAIGDGSIQRRRSLNAGQTDGSLSVLQEENVVRMVARASVE